jgi:hypothetical protein
MKKQHYILTILIAAVVLCAGCSSLPTGGNNSGAPNPPASQQDLLLLAQHGQRMMWLLWGGLGVAVLGVGLTGLNYYLKSQTNGISPFPAILGPATVGVGLGAMIMTELLSSRWFLIWTGVLILVFLAGLGTVAFLSNLKRNEITKSGS